VCRPSFEWNVNGEHASYSDYALMRNKWGSNAVRISLNQDFWLASSSYAATIDQQIAWVRQLDMGVILDLHWNNGAQQNMADRNSITFWSQVAARYKNNPWVMFELYNEPHDVTWSQWLNGDATYAGMQNMYDAIREQGADNVVIVGGLNWAYDLSGVGQGYAVKGSNIAYATHPYNYPGKLIDDWASGFGFLAASYPIIMTEFGQYCATSTYVADLLNYAESLGMHWTAWAWYVQGCEFPSVIADWDGNPFPGVGETVMRYMAGHVPTTAPGNTQAPTTAPTTAPPASGTLSVYADGLQSGWQDWSWSTSYSLSDSQYVRSGSKSIRFEIVKYQGVYFHSTTTFPIHSYSQLVFYVNGGSSTKPAGAVSVKLYSNSGTTIGSPVNLPVAPTANQWSYVSIPISAFGVSPSTLISGFVFQANADASAGVIWIDDVQFVPAGSNPTTAPTSAPTTRPTTAPTTRPTNAPTSAPTSAPTTRPTSAPTSAPTTRPTNAPTNAPTTRPTSAPTSAPGACDASSVRLVQTAGGSWDSNGKTVTQYSVEVTHSCPGKTLVGMTFTASNWNPVNFWNLQANGNSFSLPSYASITSSNSFVIGYQNTGGQASFTITSVTFQ